MKKLTAGILTVMLGIVAANSADASIASKGYVDAQVGTKVSTSDFTAFQTTNTSAIADAKKAGTDAAAALDTYKTSNDAAVAAKADSATVNAELAKKQDKLVSTDNVVINDDNTITLKGIATDTGLADLQKTVGEHTTTLGTLTGDGDGSIAKSIADAISGEVTRADGAYATAAQGAKADSAVQPAAIADMETKTNASATYATKTALEGVDGKFANYTTTTDMNKALDLKADKATIGEVETGKTVVEMIADAKSAASGDTTALQARVKTIEDSDVMASGATKEKIDAIATNTTNISANKTAVEAVAKDLADNYTKTTDLGALAKAAPGECSNPTKKCALVFDGTSYAWEVIERDAENQ
ncbi:MAG: hypothetical protein Q4E56_02765 [Pseudomonadota bacterium]|nr:hypothetical protein [Pseudomonadota bacterium]